MCLVKYRRSGAINSAGLLYSVYKTFECILISLFKIYPCLMLLCIMFIDKLKLFCFPVYLICASSETNPHCFSEVSYKCRQLTRELWIELPITCLRDKSTYNVRQPDTVLINSTFLLWIKGTNAENFINLLRVCVYILDPFIYELIEWPTVKSYSDLH